MSNVNKTVLSESQNFFGQKVSDFRPKINAPRDVGFVLPLKSEIDETELSKNTSKTIFASIATHVGKFFLAGRDFWQHLRFGKNSDFFGLFNQLLDKILIQTLQTCVVKL